MAEFVQDHLQGEVGIIDLLDADMFKLGDDGLAALAGVNQVGAVEGIGPGDLLAEPLLERPRI